LIKHNHNPNPVRLLKLKNKTTQFFTNFARNKRITQFQNSMYKKITFLLLITILVSCKNADADDSDKNEKDKIRTAHWLIGSWEFKSTDGILSENWKKLNDSTYRGESYFIKGTDTLHCETITLQQKEEDLSYLTTIIGQNNDEPISFALTETTEKQLVFENQKLDYPKKIIYNHLSKDSLVTEISGLQSGKPSSEKYLMKRLK
jgi:hypothetical protein